MDPLELARPGLFLGWRCGKKKVFHAFYRKKLCIIEIADHPMMWKIFEEKGQPLCGVRPYAEIYNVSMNLSVDLSLISLRLVGDRPPRPPSAILCHLIRQRAHVDRLIAGPFPLFPLDPAVHLGRLSLASDELSIELEIGEPLVF